MGTSFRLKIQSHSPLFSAIEYHHLIEKESSRRKLKNMMAPYGFDTDFGSNFLVSIS